MAGPRGVQAGPRRAQAGLQPTLEDQFPCQASLEETGVCGHGILEKWDLPIRADLRPPEAPFPPHLLCLRLSAPPASSWLWVSLSLWEPPPLRPNYLNLQESLMEYLY